MGRAAQVEQRDIHQVAVVAGRCFGFGFGFGFAFDSATKKVQTTPNAPSEG
jgi:hypothetical protein